MRQDLSVPWTNEEVAAGRAAHTAAKFDTKLRKIHPGRPLPEASASRPRILENIREGCAQELSKRHSKTFSTVVSGARCGDKG